MLSCHHSSNFLLVGRKFHQSVWCRVRCKWPVRLVGYTVAAVSSGFGSAPAAPSPLLVLVAQRPLLFPTCHRSLQEANATSLFPTKSWRRDRTQNVLLIFFPTEVPNQKSLVSLCCGLHRPTSGKVSEAKVGCIVSRREQRARGASLTRAKGLEEEAKKEKKEITVFYATTSQVAPRRNECGDRVSTRP
jgi:hypothetical protein